MKYYVIAGEVSGDLHASFLIRELKNRDPLAEIRAFGGDNMKREGAFIAKDIKELNFMGFVEVVKNIFSIYNNLSFCRKDILSFNPDCVIFFDYPGFNLRIAKFCHKKGIKTIYCISPKVWAWKKGRIKKMKKILDKLFVIFPFEKEFFKKYNFDVEYYGNPLLDEIKDYKQKQDKEKFLKENNLGEKPIVALLPGSRKQEIQAMLPIQLSLVDKFEDFDFVVAALRNHPQSLYQRYIKNTNVKLVFDNTYSVLQNAYCAIVCSGTATLETALFNVPEVVCYRANPISFAIGKWLVKLKFISLVNIILNRRAVLELLQGDWNEENLEKEFRKLSYDETYRAEMEMNYSNLKVILGDCGASYKIAKRIVEILDEKK
ncbi:MAG: lipid-A-disaccharide synthase [Bacteroidales bacterium]|jgi:lipid-A-disaccharide synthase|nr:lipid-A-disaccharide synthase [Bacteroidales bacterium]